jgi:hypothetical protein
MGDLVPLIHRMEDLRARASALARAVEVRSPTLECHYFSINFQLKFRAMIVFTHTILYLILVNAGVTYVEGKRELVMLENIHQLVATSITCAFTAHNLNEELNSMVPTILTNHNSFVVCLYDCCKDYLLLSEPYQYTVTKKLHVPTVSPPVGHSKGKVLAASWWV